jgi:hypothetical protein
LTAEQLGNVTAVHRMLLEQLVPGPGTENDDLVGMPLQSVRVITSGRRRRRCRPNMSCIPANNHWATAAKCAGEIGGVVPIADGESGNEIQWPDDGQVPAGQETVTDVNGQHATRVGHSPLTGPGANPLHRTGEGRAHQIPEPAI